MRADFERPRHAVRMIIPCPNLTHATALRERVRPTGHLFIYGAAEPSPSTR